MPVRWGAIASGAPRAAGPDLAPSRRRPLSGPPRAHPLGVLAGGGDDPVDAAAGDLRKRAPALEGGAPADDGLVAGGEEGGVLGGPAGLGVVADGVDGAVLAVEGAFRGTLAGTARAQAGLAELLRRDAAPLSPGDLGDCGFVGSRDNNL